ncbi:P-type conjugative transfer protein TrbJ [Candidatus Fukatsuia endosymbiont of Tuberolachnus salignus]|uniref:P-type conjugative transfer protein TrbJ n=1 Tax=Candidatus Fukatsuia endosymbiont of Tuberolachnus salignus TaxID=3077957 RepID=UPI00313CD472
MKKNVKQTLTSKINVLTMIIAGLMSQQVVAWPVFDVPHTAVSGANALTTAGTKLEQGLHYMKQVNHYRQQINHYKEMVEKLSSYNWDDPLASTEKLLQAQNTLNDYKRKLGGLEQYLLQYKDLKGHLSSPCFTSGGCTDSQRQELLKAQDNASEVQKLAYDAVLTGIDQQQKSLQKDSGQLTKLQSQVESAKSQMQAAQAASQLASAQANQLLQIRGLLMAQQNAEATRAQVIADSEAQAMASSRQLRNSSNISSPTVKTWSW